MPSKRTRARSGKATAPTADGRLPSATKGNVPRKTNGQFQPGFSGQPGGDAGRARKALNLDTIREMHLAFQRGGRKAIDKVMVNAPAQFLKLLVLLVPRELEVTRAGGVKGMSDEQLEQAISAIEGFLAKRAAGPGADAKLVEGVVAEEPSATPT